MAFEITMPQLSDTMSEGRLLSWNKKEGDKVGRGEALAEVATDKADLEIESFHEGTLLKLLANIGDTIKVGTVIAIIGEPGETVTSAPSAPKAAQPKISQPAQAMPAAAPQVQNASNGASSVSTEHVKISPLAKNIAQTEGVDYRNIQGSGEGGRIVRRDIEAQIGKSTAPQAPAPQMQTAPIQAPPVQRASAPTYATPAFVAPVAAAPVSGGHSMEPLSRMRQTIAARMVESVTTIPHFYVTSKIHVDALVRIRESLKTLGQYEGLTYTHLILKAAALALRAVPRVNASFQNGNLVQPQDVNIGIVTAIPDGLLIPIVKQADLLTLSDVTQEARALVQRARAGRPKADDLVGGTFSISNMGMFAVEDFTAIISPGQGAILAVSAMGEEAIVEKGEVRVGKVIRLTLSVDHRIIDGIVAGEFLTEMKRLLEDPVLLLA